MKYVEKKSLEKNNDDTECEHEDEREAEGKARQAETEVVENKADLEQEEDEEFKEEDEELNRTEGKTTCEKTDQDLHVNENVSVKQKDEIDFDESTMVVDESAMCIEESFAQTETQVTQGSQVSEPEAEAPVIIDVQKPKLPPILPAVTALPYPVIRRKTVSVTTTKMVEIKIKGADRVQLDRQRKDKNDRSA